MAWPTLLLAADRAALQHLGGSIRYTPSGGQPVDVRGIFDAAYVRVDAGQAGVTSCGPVVFVRTEDLPTDPEVDEGATITVEGVQYRIQEPEKDGQGGALLFLRRV